MGQSFVVVSSRVCRRAEPGAKGKIRTQATACSERAADVGPQSITLTNINRTAEKKLAGPDPTFGCSVSTDDDWAQLIEGRGWAGRVGVGGAPPAGEAHAPCTTVTRDSSSRIPGQPSGSPSGI